MGLEHHTPENIRAEIEHAVSHDTDFHQFMLYTPVPGTPLYDEMSEQGRMLHDVDLADIHGQYKFNFEHAAISRDESKQLLDWAFRLDFETNGPSLYRIWRTTLEGWKRYKDHPEPRVRERFDWEARQLKSASARLACGPWSAASSETNEAVSRRIQSAAARNREGIRAAEPHGLGAGRPGPAVDLAPGREAPGRRRSPTSRAPSSSAATGSKPSPRRNSAPRVVPARSWEGAACARDPRLHRSASGARPLR